MSPATKPSPSMPEAGSGTLLPVADPALLDELQRVLPGPGQVRSRAVDRLALGHDASHYLLTPTAVVTPRDAADVGRLFAVSAAQGVPLTFRSGGTSLSGQAGTDGVLVDTRKHFRGIEVLDDGARVRVQPGATVRQVNARLARHGRKLGPDPASEIACTHRRRRRQQLQRHGLRHRREHLPHAGVAGARAARRHRRRHRRPPTPTSGCAPTEPELYEGLAAAARPGARQPASRCATIRRSSR